MPENEFPCLFCKEPAFAVLYYSKVYQESGRNTIENPCLICEKCYADPEKKGQLFASRGGWEGVQYLSFKNIVEMSAKGLGVLLSKYDKEKNDLANKTWRKRIWRIHFRMREGKNTDKISKL